MWCHQSLVFSTRVRKKTKQQLQLMLSKWYSCEYIFARDEFGVWLDVCVRKSVCVSGSIHWHWCCWCPLNINTQVNTPPTFHQAKTNCITERLIDVVVVLYFFGNFCCFHLLFFWFGIIWNCVMFTTYCKFFFGVVSVTAANIRGIA